MSVYCSLCKSPTELDCAMSPETLKIGCNLSLQAISRYAAYAKKLPSVYPALSGFMRHVFTSALKGEELKKALVQFDGIKADYDVYLKDKLKGISKEIVSDKGSTQPESKKEEKVATASAAPPKDKAKKRRKHKKR